MTKDDIIKKLRDMARYPTVTLPRDKEALSKAADLLAEQALAQPAAETPYEIGQRVFRTGMGISDIWGAVKHDSDLDEATRGFNEAQLAATPLSEMAAKLREKNGGAA